MKVLFVVTRPPFPPWRGDQVRSYNLLRHLARRHDITLVIAGPTPPGMVLAAASALGVRVRHLPTTRPGGLLRLGRILWDRRPVQVFPFTGRRHRREVAVLAAEHDLVHGQLLRVAPMLPGDRPVVVDLVDSLSLNLQRRAEHDRGPTAWASRREAVRLGRYERVVTTRSAATIVSSRDDAAHLGGSAVVVPNGVDLDRFGFRAAPRTDPVVVFAGNLGYFPNVDAALMLAGEIMPALRHQVSGARLVIAGARPARSVRRLADADTTVVSEPDDLGAVVAAAAVAVVPVRAGSGIQNKVLEAMAVGTPVVTTERVATAIGANSGVHLLVADGVEATAAAAARILQDPGLADGLRRAARSHITERFTWERAAAIVEQVWEQAAAG
jgi:glycosyltransferase involved in cell wall biosynthesis